MTSTYAAYHSIIAQGPFEHYVQEPYQDLVASSQAYGSSAPYETPLTTMDSNLGFPLSAYSDPVRNDSLYPIASSSGVGLDSHNAYSPVPSPGEPHAPPRLSASSESVPSTSSSSMGSPHMNAQYSNEWNPMFQNGLEALQDVYFQTSAEQSSSKLSGFVGESTPLISSVQSGNFSNSLVNSSPAFATVSNKSQTGLHLSPVPSILEPEHSFNSPGSPASAINTTRGRNSTPPASPWWQSRSSPSTRRGSLLANEVFPSAIPPISPQSQQPFERSSLLLPSPMSNSFHHVNSPHYPSVVAQPFTFPQLYPDLPAPASPGIFEQVTSPAATISRTGKAKKSPGQSSFSHFQPNAFPYHSQRRQSTSSSMSRNSSQRSGSFDVDEVDGGRGVCPIPDCGKSFKDLKAHMLTHQNERPEKCPISSCEYHIKGFARKYDKNRHTLTHYKGTMVCGFCPGSGSSAEKSFNRADVFKRHLTSVHGVEQVPPNARRKSPSSRKNNTAGQASGMCSTCGVTFPSAQDFYEHLDDCVLRVVQQIDPAEAINEKHLTTINEDKEVQDMLEKHNLTGSEYTTSTYDEDEDDDEDDDGSDARAQRSGKGTIRVKKGEQAGAGTSWNPSNRINKRRTGLTLSKGGVRLAGPAISGRKKRKNYPASWGCSPDKMRMKKRVLCAYDGQRRLWKDDLMLDAEFEVRVPLPTTDGRGAYVTDLDIQTMRRAEAIFSATEEERGPWVQDNVIERDFTQMFA